MVSYFFREYKGTEKNCRFGVWPPWGQLTSKAQNTLEMRKQICVKRPFFNEILTTIDTNFHYLYSSISKANYIMKNLIALFALSLSLFSTSAKANDTTALVWYTNLDSVVTLSNENKKPIFGFFTGSDWCGWCIKLQREVFAKPAFIEWANANVILLELDFPRKKVLPQDLRVQNQNLQQAFNVQGYPTVWVFSAVKNVETNNFSLTAWGKLGYPQGAEAGKEEVKFLADAEAVMAKSVWKEN